jgi:hypothetical protein
VAGIVAYIGNVCSHLLGAVIVATRQAGSPVLKSSSLASLVILDVESKVLLGGVLYESELEQNAKGLYVKLARDKAGYWKL